MFDDILTFTIFFKLDVDKRDSEDARNRIAAFVQDYKAERYKNFGFTFQDEFKNGAILWQRVKDVAGSDMNCIYINHSNLGLATPRKDLWALIRPKLENDLDISLDSIEQTFGSLP